MTELKEEEDQGPTEACLSAQITALTNSVIQMLLRHYTMIKENFEAGMKDLVINLVIPKVYGIQQDLISQQEFFPQNSRAY